MVTGYDIWTRLAPFERDYFLPLPLEDPESTCMKPALYPDVCAMSRALFRTVSAPTRVLDAGPVPSEVLSSCHWVSSDEPLFSVPLLWSYFTEHSDRATLMSWLAAHGYIKEVRNFAGGWSTQGSDSYIRTARTAIGNAQRFIADSARNGDLAQDVLADLDVLEGIERYLQSKGVAQDLIDAQLDRLRLFGRSPVPQGGRAEHFALSPGGAIDEQEDEDLGFEALVAQDESWGGGWLLFGLGDVLAHC